MRPEDAKVRKDFHHHDNHNQDLQSMIEKPEECQGEGRFSGARSAHNSYQKTFFKF